MPALRGPNPTLAVRGSDGSNCTPRLTEPLTRDEKLTAPPAEDEFKYLICEVLSDCVVADGEVEDIGEDFEESEQISCTAKAYSVPDDKPETVAFTTRERLTRRFSTRGQDIPRSNEAYTRQAVKEVPASVQESVPACQVRDTVLMVDFQGTTF
jgi:hypothetical protein